MLKIAFHEKKTPRGKYFSMSNFKLLIVQKHPFERTMIKKKTCVVEFFLTKQASLLDLGREVSTV